MKYVSLDIETTGTQVGKHQVIEVGAVIDDLQNPTTPIAQLPSFHTYVVHDEYVVDEYVLGMHADSGIWKKLQERPDSDSFIKPEEVGPELARWLFQNGMAKHAPEDIGAFHRFMKNFGSGGYPDFKERQLFRDGLPIFITCAGKNFGSFDLPFLNSLPNFQDYVRISHRVLDPGTLYLQRDDDTIPNSSKVFERAGMGQHVAHTALEDARDMLAAIRHAFPKTELTE
jgi:hypothetical protein